VSYAAKEASAQDSYPIALYEFLRRVNSVDTYWRYAAFPTNIVSGPNDDTFTAEEGIVCGKKSSTGKVNKENLTITLPLDNPLAAEFVGTAPNEVTTLTIYRTHYDDTERRFEWKGRIVSPSVSLKGVVLTCESIFTSLQRPGLRDRHQRNCGNVFGGPGCFVDVDALALSFHATASVGSIVTIPTFTGTWKGGQLEALGVKRLIIEQSGTSFTLIRPIAGLADLIAESAFGWVAVTLYPGCPKTIEACLDNDNVGNFKGNPGQKYINPFSVTSSVF
jgi:hypothetical protein